MDTSKECLLPEWYEVNPDIEENLKEVLSKPVSKRQKVSTGYSWDGESRYCYPVEEAIVGIIKLLADTRYSDKKSLREAVDALKPILEDLDLPPVTTAGGLSNLFTRMEGKLGISNGHSNGATRLRRYIKIESLKGNWKDVSVKGT